MRLVVNFNVYSKKIKDKKMKLMKVYVVIEEDRGMGADVQGVFQDKEQAEKLAEQSSHFFIEESVFHAMD